MLIRFPSDAVLRRRAAVWLIDEDISHTWLFQAVMIDNPADAGRFRHWLDALAVTPGQAISALGRTSD